MSHIKNFAAKTLLYGVSFLSLLISSWFFFGTNQEEDIIQTQSQFNLFFQTNPPTVFSETRTAGFGVSGLGSEVLWNAVGGVSSTVLDTLDMAELDSIATSNDFRLLHQMSNSDPITDTLKLSRFGFTIPPGANILGITLTLEKVQGNSNGNLIDTIITLTNPNLGIPANKKSAGLWPQLPSADALIAYGGASDLWNATWTPSEINADAFGALIRVRKTEAISTPSATTARLDLVSITVSYNFPCVDVFTETKGAGAGVSGPGNINTYWRDSAAVMGEPTPPALVTLLAKGLDSLNTSNNMRLFSQLNVNNLITDSLTLNQFGFNIPSGATILGIKLTIEKMQGNNNGNLLDTVITILNPASGIPVNKKSALTWPRTDTVFNYGGANDLWGPATWTPASINSNSFGALIRVRKSGAGATTARIDSISISVTYKFQERISKVFVDSSVAVTGDGLSWGTAFKTLQEGLNACFVDTICVAQGTYYPVSAGAGVPRRDISFCIPDSVKLFGGYPSGGMGERNWVCNKTILCGDIDLNGDTLNNSYHVVYTKNVDSATIIDGFFIRGGNANGLPNGDPSSAGGGWYNDGSGAGGNSRPTIINCVFSANTARNGGAMANVGNNLGNASPHLINCLITGNVASGVGGGLVNNGIQGICLPVLTNCVISGNSSTLGGGALNVGNVGGGGVCTLTINNSIVWNNSSTSDANASNTFGNAGASTSVYYSILQAGGFTTGTLGMGINGNKPAGTDPLFVFAPLAGLSTAGDFHVKAGSMAIDMGNDAYNSYPFDLDGRPRIVNTIDIGAYESGSPECSIYLGITRIYVDSSATGGNNGFDWDSAFTNLQDALELARLCSVDTILVARGTYYPSDTIKYYDACEALSFTALPDREVSFNITDSVVMLGGFPNGGGSFNERDWYCNKTILCGDIDRNGDTLNNSYHIITTINASDATIVDGFCITGGNANGSPFKNTVGGGLSVQNSNLQIKNCVVTDNHADYGGAMHNVGLFGLNSKPVFTNCIISNNTADTSGGAFYIQGSNSDFSPTFINCLITGNAAGSYGGAFYNLSGPGGICSPVIINSVISGNRAVINGGAMYNNNLPGGTCIPSLTNSIVWNNSSTFFNAGTAMPTVRYSMIQTPGNYTNGGNNKPDGTDPLFVNSPMSGAAPTAIGNFHVQANSLAIDMGLDGANTYPTDLDGNPRVQGARIDIGAYEFQVGFLCTDYTGLTTIYVDSTATGGNNGFDWDSAFTDLQDALAVARICGIDT
ncbi:MAG: choice-of-anchor Q domain-containing protein, partial [Saprospiraceae bacterium]